MAAKRLDADVLIVGAGPAGCAAAIACATAGLQTILAERHDEPRDHPGEALAPRVELLLSQLGVAHLEPVTGARYEGVWTGWGEPPRFEAFGEHDDGPLRGLQVDRRGLDALLLARARDAGVEVMSGTKVEEPDVDAGVVLGARTQFGRMEAPIVVDATGTARWISAAMGLATSLHSPQLVVRYGYVQGSCAERDDAPALVADETGWTWTARVAASRYQWMRLDLEAPQRQGTWLPDELAGLKPLGPARGADVSWRLSRAPAGPGWFIIGDAAATLDPSSGQGVLRALTSGRVVAQLAGAVTRQELPMLQAATAYQQWLGEEFRRDVARLAKLYARVEAEGFG